MTFNKKKKKKRFARLNKSNLYVNDLVIELLSSYKSMHRILTEIFYFNRDTGLIVT